ncbi:MAG: arsinothricin resistance N-acetyltransferase ArsN1 family A [Dehalococcoidia bacterium]
MSPETSMIVRQAEAADAEAIARIYNQGIEDRVAAFETEPRTADQIASLLSERADHYPTIVVEREREVVAWAGAGSYRSRPCYAGIAECSVYVERAARGSGAGSAVLVGLIAAYQERGFWKLVSRIFPENVASRAMCRRAGFREVGVYKRHGQLDGDWRDCVIVERLLGRDAEGLETES